MLQIAASIIFIEMATPPNHIPVEPNRSSRIKWTRMPEHSIPPLIERRAALAELIGKLERGESLTRPERANLANIRHIQRYLDQDIRRQLDHIDDLQRQRRERTPGQQEREAIGPDGRPLPPGFFYDGRTIYGPGGGAGAPGEARPAPGAQGGHLREQIDLIKEQIRDGIVTPENGNRRINELLATAKKEEKESKQAVAAERESWSERFAKHGSNLNLGFGAFFGPGAFVNILLVILIILFIWIVLRVFFPMVP